MSTVVLTFKLPDEADEANAAQHGAAVVGILADLDNELRSLVKYHDGDTVGKQELERLRQLISEGCADAGVNLW